MVVCQVTPKTDTKTPKYLSIGKEGKVVPVKEGRHGLSEQAGVDFVSGPKLAKGAVEGKLGAVDGAGQRGG